MNPPAEQLIRDYLNRVSVAARGRLSPDERRAFVARTRELIEQNTRGTGQVSPMGVARFLNGLGDPAALVARECDRLAAQPPATSPASPPGAAAGRPRTERERRARSGPGAWIGRLRPSEAPLSGVPVPRPAGRGDGAPAARAPGGTAAGGTAAGGTAGARLAPRRAAPGAGWRCGDRARAHRRRAAPRTGLRDRIPGGSAASGPVPAGRAGPFRAWAQRERARSGRPTATARSTPALAGNLSPAVARNLSPALTAPPNRSLRTPPGLSRAVRVPPSG